MATENPTGDGHAVPLAIPARNMPFLRCVIGAARDGLLEELDKFADRLQSPRSDLLREEAAYLTLLGALDLGRVVPDRELCAVLAQLAEAVDRDNEYRRAVSEHDALRDLDTAIRLATALEVPLDDFTQGIEWVRGEKSPGGFLVRPPGTVIPAKSNQGKPRNPKEPEAEEPATDTPKHRSQRKKGSKNEEQLASRLTQPKRSQTHYAPQTVVCFSCLSGRLSTEAAA